MDNNFIPENLSKTEAYTSQNEILAIPLPKMSNS